MRFEAKLNGFEAFNKLLGELPVRVENKVLQKAAVSALREARPDIVAAAPRDMVGQSPASKKYGRLYKNIRVLRLRRTRQKGIRGARINTGNAFWGLLLEIGTKYISPRPWFLPAFKKAIPKINDKLGQEIGAGIITEARGMGAK